MPGRLWRSVRHLFARQPARPDAAAIDAVSIDTAAAPASFDAARLPVVLLLKPLSGSLSHRVYRDEIEGRPFVAWFVDRLRTRFPSIDLHVRCHDADEAAEVERLVGGRARVVRPVAATPLQAYAEIAARVSSPFICFVHEGFAFAPPDLLRRVFAYHVRHANRYTPVHGLPHGSTPDLYDARFLGDLARAPVPRADEDPAILIQRLAHDPNAKSTRVLLSVRAEAFDADVAYGVGPGDLPEHLWISSAREIAIAREVIAATTYDGAGGPLGDYRRWREAVVARQRHACDALRSGPAIITHQTSGQSSPSPLSASASRTRVLFVSNPSAFSGGEASLCQLAARLDASRFALSAVVGGDGVFADRLRAAGVDVHTPSCGFGGERGPEDLVYLRDAFTAIAPDIIHFNAWSGTPALHLASLLRVPIVTHCRAAALDALPDLLKASDAVIAVSDFVRRLLLRLEIPEERIHVIYNNVDLEAFDPERVPSEAARATLGLPAQARIILTIARFAPNKRYDLLLAAAEYAKRQAPDLHLVLCGEILGGAPETHDRVMSQIQSRGLSSWITVLPFVHDVRELHAASDALVLCSDAEPLGRSVLEAMAMARPAIVTDSGGNHEHIEHGRTGFVVPANDPHALAAQIVRVVKDRELAARVGAAARAHAQAALDGRETVARVSALYDGLRTRSGAGVTA